jgi:hypothetical protein
MRLLLLFIFLTSSVYGQVSEIITETWYLRSIKLDGNYKYLPLGETIELNFIDNSGDIYFETNGVENVLGGDVVFDNTPEMLDLFNISVTLTECLESNCPFEDIYFYGLLTDENLNPKSFTYSYITFTNGNKLLKLTDANGNEARFLNSALQEPSSELFQIWYLHSMETDLGETTYVANFDPPISPSITINPDYTFSGSGSCNTFNGQFNYTDSAQNDKSIFATFFEKTGQTCENHSDFEDYYFSHFEGGELLRYFYEDDFFNFELSPGFTFNFYNYPVLSNEDYTAVKINIYPNPTKGLLKIEAFEPIKELVIYSILGEIVFSEKEIDLELDISFLKSGVYIIVVTTESGIQTKKLIKQ